MKINAHIKAVFLLMALTILVFGTFFSPSEDIVISSKNTDISKHYIPLRSFGFNELRNGNLPLWNPHIFSGTPFVGGFIAAMLYPLNLVFLVFPLGKAINLTIALHTFLVGLFMYFWASIHKLSMVAKITCAIMVMSGGIYSPHIYAGHLSQICTMTWAPLLFLSIDGWIKQGVRKWILLGIPAVTMMVIAGFPQYAYYCSLAAVIYAGLRIFQVKKDFLKHMGGIALIFAGGVVLASAQVLAGFDATSESVRSAGLPYAFAQTFSFPPENLITLLSPSFLGTMADATYWGRAYLFEMTIFISTTGFILAVLALVRKGIDPVRYVFLMVILVTLIVAMGAHTPLFSLLYHTLPGFDRFRGVSKFIYPATLFLILLSGMGIDSIIKKPLRSSYPSRLLIALSFIAIICAWAIQQSSENGETEGWWHGAMVAIHNAASANGEAFHPSEDYDNPKFVRETGKRAANSLYLSALIGMLLALLFSFSKRRYRTGWAIFLLVAIELIGFAFHWRDSFPLKENRLEAIEPYLLDKVDEMGRVCNTLSYNNGMLSNNYDISGYDAMVQRRYSEMFYYAAGLPPDRAGMYLPLTLEPRIPSLFRMLRCEKLFLNKTNKIVIASIKNPMKQLHLINDYQVIKNRDGIFKALSSPQFDPLKTVILEKKPFFEPANKEVKGYARVLDRSTDHLTIETELTAPAVLLITDTFHSSWRVRSIRTDSNQKYEVMPANYAFRAVPLKAGHHLFRLEYAPREFVIGLWVSVISLILYVCYLLFTIVQRLNLRSK